MKVSLFALGLALALAACESSPPRAAQPVVDVRVPSLAEQVAAQAAATKPGRHHRALDPLVGAWETRSATVDREGRESDPVPGKAAIDWALAGRFLRIDQSIDLPEGSHVSSGFLGYDEAHGEYQLVQVTDLSTGMGVARGQGDLAQGGIRFTLDVIDPNTGGLARAVSVLRLLDPGHCALEIIGSDPSGMQRVLRRTHYQRAGVAPVKR